MLAVTSRMVSIDNYGLRVVVIARCDCCFLVILVFPLIINVLPFVNCLELHSIRDRIGENDDDVE